jgi:hypothetical protein
MMLHSIIIEDYSATLCDFLWFSSLVRQMSRYSLKGTRPCFKTEGEEDFILVSPRSYPLVFSACFMLFIRQHQEIVSIYELKIQMQ